MDRRIFQIRFYLSRIRRLDISKPRGLYFNEVIREFRVHQHLAVRVTWRRHIAVIAILNLLSGDLILVQLTEVKNNLFVAKGNKWAEFL